MGEHVSFSTIVDDIIDDDTLAILAPLKKERQEAVKPGESLRLTCVTELGLYMFDAQLKRSYTRGLVCVLEVRALGEIKMIQRRESYRARESIEVSVRKVVTDPDTNQERIGKWVKTRTIDVSETGMLVRFNEECEENQKLEIVFRLKNHGLNEVLPKITGKVTRCVDNGSKQFGYFLGVHFTDVPEKARNALLKLVVLSQRSKMAYKPKRKNQYE
jgi:c-di-GMP-binding flagellar brake protein YcgR